MTAEHDRIPVSCNTPMPAPDQSGSTSVRAERLRADGSPRCEYCDDSGDVHTIIGDWLGICHCEIGQELQRSLDLGRTST